MSLRRFLAASRETPNGLVTLSLLLLLGGMTIVRAIEEDLHRANTAFDCRLAFLLVLNDGLQSSLESCFVGLIVEEL